MIFDFSDYINLNLETVEQESIRMRLALYNYEVNGKVNIHCNSLEILKNIILNMHSLSIMKTMFPCFI